MDIEEWVAAAAVVISAGAGWIALLARSDSKRSADAAEEALTLQREEAEARRAPDKPQPRLALERADATTFLLRNTGGAPATTVKVLDHGLSRIVRSIPRSFTLHPGEALSFPMSPSSSTGEPTQIWVTWEGLDDPVALPVPRTW